MDLEMLLNRIRKGTMNKIIMVIAIYIVGNWWVFSGSGQWIDIKRQIITRTGTVYFVDNSNLLINAVGLAIILGIIITAFPKFKKMNAITVYTTLIAVCIGFAMMIELFMYSYITPEGIYNRHGFWSKEKYYSWNQVTSVDIGYHSPKDSKKNSYFVEYIVSLDDGTKIELNGSKDFFLSILRVDGMFSEQKIPIHRSPITHNDAYFGLTKSLSEQVSNTNLKLLHYEKKGPPEI